MTIVKELAGGWLASSGPTAREKGTDEWGYIV
jgi:hypothetical protein